MNADELRRLRADITYAMDLRHTYLDREETRWRILETVVSKPFRAFLDERSNQLQVIERDRLARALHDSYLRDPAMTRIEWGDLNDAEKRMWRSHARAVGDEYERLSALDSTTGDPE